MGNFPKNFLWGSATAAHQVEGGMDNDWSDWEKSLGDRFSKNPRYSSNPKYVSEGIKAAKSHSINYISAKSGDHFNLFKADIDLLKSLNQNSYRFSIEWSRIEPKNGEFNLEAIDHYKTIIEYLKENGIEPVVTLWHFTNPLWIRDIGGWENTKTIEYFCRYTAKIVEAMEDKVKYWITINEPEVYAADGYLAGYKYPEKKNPYLYNKVLLNLIKAHQQAYTVIKKLRPVAMVSVAKHFTYFHLRNPANRADALLVRTLNWFQNYRVLKGILNYCDFIGVNFYFTIEVGSRKNVKDFTSLAPRIFMDNTSKYSDMGWPLYPENIYHVLMSLKRLNKPIMVTENGLADAEDKHRKWFLESTFSAMEKAIKEGVDLIGYMHWSLLDNFEWSDGYGPRFGLIEIDYLTLKRSIRSSANFYSEYIKSQDKL